MTTRLTLFLFSALLAGTAGAAAGDKTDVVRDLAGRVGPIVGSALACRDIARYSGHHRQVHSRDHGSRDQRG